MPRYLQPAALYTVTSRAVAALLYTSCRQLDQLEQAEQLEEPQLSPRTPPRRSCRPGTSSCWPGWPTSRTR